MFAGRVKSLRKQERYSLEEFGKLIGVRGNTIWRWEHNKARPDTDTVVKIARALNTTAAYLLGETDNPDLNTLFTQHGTSEQIQEVFSITKKIGNEDDDLKTPVTNDDDLKTPVTSEMYEYAITVTDNNTNFTYSFPNNEEGRKSLVLFLGVFHGHEKLRYNQ